MSTNAPTGPVTLPKNLGAYYKGAGTDKDGGWGKLKKMVGEGRRVAREERLRWQENREYYRGNSAVFIAPGENQLRGVLRGPIGSGHDNVSYNRLRQFCDGRTALLTKERPAYEVIPEDRDQDSIDAAKQAEKFIAARWGHTGWNIKNRLHELANNGDIDGIAWLAVQWDPDAGNSKDSLIAVDAQTGQPVTDRATFEGLKAQDPNAEMLWRMERTSKPMGDVCWRVILPGAVSVDPFAVKDPREARWICESRVRPREEVERKLGMSFKAAVKESSSQSGGRMGDVQYEDIALDDGGGASRTINEANGVVVHYFYAKPSEEFPKGLHVEFCDKAPGKPMLIEEWEGELPYFCFIPRPDPGHFIRSRGIVDDLKPIQRDYNSTLRDLREWLKRVARNPVMMPFGSLASDSFYNSDGVAFFHPQMGEPHYGTFPSEPTAVLTNDLGRMVQEMREISGISAPSQGMRAPGGPESAAGINLELQQTETNLSETEANLVEAIEWGVQRSLRLVERHYAVPRVVTGLGVDDSEEFKAFQGAMLRGAHRFTVTSPLMPKSKAARMAAIQQLIPMLGPQVLPHIGGLIDGDPTELVNELEADKKKQRRETRELIGLALDEKALLVFKNFEDDKKAYSEATNLVIQSGSQDPVGDLAAQGVNPPMLTQMLVLAGFDLPLVDDIDDNHAIELHAYREFRKSDGYPKIHPMSKQLLREHRDGHTRGMSQQMQAMAQQMPVGQQEGSAPKELGTPSQPRNQSMPAAA